MNRLIALIRKPAGIVAVISSKRAELPLTAEAMEQMPFWDASDSLYVWEEVPLEQVSADLYPGKEQLQAAWNALQSVASLDTATLANTLLVVTETVGEEQNTPLPPILLTNTEPRRILPTAAHPRAYKGTKAQPPKEKKPPVTDLRPALCDRRALNIIQSRIDARSEAIFDLLKSEDIPCSAHARQPKILLRDVGVSSDVSFPALFRRWLLPALQKSPDSDIADYLAFYWQAGLEQKPALLHAVARLLSVQSGRRTLHWLAILLEQPEELYLAFVTLLLESQAYCLDSTVLTASDKEFLAGLHAGPFYAYRLYCLFQAMQQGVALDFLRQGYALADVLDPDYPFLEVRQSGFYPLESAAELMAHLEPASSYWRGMELALWKDCGEMEGLGKILTTISWKRYAPETACRYLWLYEGQISARKDLSAEIWNAKWHFIRQQVQRIENLMQTVPPQYQLKCLDYLGDGFWYWDTVAELTANMPWLYRMLPRLAQTPFTTREAEEAILCAILGRLSASEKERLLNAPDRSFKRMEQDCRRKNDAYLIRLGLESLTARVPEFVVSGFIERPARLFRTSLLLGCLPEAMRTQVIREYAASQASRHGALLTRLEALEQQTMQAIEAGFPIFDRDDAARHALQIHRSIHRNRRGLRKFLQAYWSGQTDYVLHHPLTQAWLRKHPCLNREVWLRGITLTREIEPYGILHLTMEQDPLEKLRMGTYVGSCLGLGGSFAYSAVANMLDINKQVLYVRNRRGSVLARQLIAVSEQDELVCFDIYPYSSGVEIKRMFREADRRFAQELGIELFTQDRYDKHDVAHILSEHWWDDYTWDFKIKG